MLFTIKKRLFVQHEEKTFCAVDSYHSKRAPVTMSDLTNLIKSETYGEQSLNHQRHFQSVRRSARELVQHARLLWGPQRWSGLEWWPPVLPPQPTACNRMLAGAGGKELRDSQRFQVISRHSKSQSVLFWHRSLPWTSSLWFLFCKVVWLFTWGPGNWRKWDKRGESEVGELAGLIRFLSCAVATSRRGKFNFGP